MIDDSNGPVAEHGGKRPRPSRIGWGSKALLLGSGLLAPALLFAALAWFDLAREEKDERQQIAITTQALAEHAQTVVETTAQVLGRVLDHVAGQNWTQIAGSPEVHEFLLGLKAEVPQLESVFLVNPAGMNVATSRAFPTPALDVSAREYFRHAASGGRDMFVSEAFKGRIDGTFSFTITRPRLANGRFDGLAGVTVSSPYFEAFYRAVAGGDGASAALIRDDGALLVRVPELPERPGFVPPSAPLVEAARLGEAGLLGAVSSIDGQYRLRGFRRLRSVPLVATYGLDREAYLADWRYHLALFAVLCVCLSAAVLFAGWALLRDAARSQDSMRALLAEQDRRRTAEQALLQAQKLEALGRVTGGVAHDFNNLLAAVLGSLELAQKRVSDPRVTRLLENARTAAARGSELTGQMLAFARRREVALQPIEVNATVQRVDSLLRGAVGALVRVRYALSDAVGFAVADPVQLETALLNLAVNARDAMPGGGELVISTNPVRVDADGAGSASLAPGSYVRVSVADSGEGMDEAVRRHVFEPFFTTKGPGKGTGLGLSTVFGFVTRAGGTATVDSAPGLGTTVSLFLPKTDSPERDGAPVADDGAQPIGERRGRLLIVDDDAAVRTTLAAMLQELGHEVAQAAGGAEALAMLNEDRRFDLILIDFAMPEMNGSRLAGEIRRIWRGGPLLFVTGYAENDGLRAWTELGVKTLSKPFTEAMLEAAVTQALERDAPPVVSAQR